MLAPCISSEAGFSDGIVVCLLILGKIACDDTPEHVIDTKTHLGLNGRNEILWEGVRRDGGNRKGICELMNYTKEVTLECGFGFVVDEELFDGVDGIQSCFLYGQAWTLEDVIYGFNGSLAKRALWRRTLFPLEVTIHDWDLFVDEFCHQNLLIWR